MMKIMTKCRSCFSFPDIYVSMLKQYAHFLQIYTYASPLTAHNHIFRLNIYTITLAHTHTHTQLMMMKIMTIKVQLLFSSPDIYIYPCWNGMPIFLQLYIYPYCNSMFIKQKSCHVFCTGRQTVLCHTVPFSASGFQGTTFQKYAPPSAPDSALPCNGEHPEMQNLIHVVS